MEYRELGRTGAKLSVLGFGGIVLCGMEQEMADQTVAEVVESGVTYFDVAPSYGDGEAEEKMGPALRPYRDECFLACKTGQRDGAGAREELERSLKRLQTSHFDLYQLHSVTTREDVEAALAPGGAIEEFERARDAGQVRFLGFSAHSAEMAVELLERYSFDSVLFPFNFSTYWHGNFGPQVVAAAQAKGAGLLALKGMARKPWPKEGDSSARAWKKTWYEPLDDERTARLALRFTLGLPITAAIPPGELELWQMALRIVEGQSALQALNPTEQSELHELAMATEPIFRANSAA